jgi:phosphogluconate dehydratase
MSLNATVASVTEDIVKRSRDRRRHYLDRIDAAASAMPKRKSAALILAHGFAGCGHGDKHALREGDSANLAIALLQRHAPRISLSSAFRRSFARQRATPAPLRARRSPPCATASPKAKPAWNCRSSRAPLIAMSTAVALSHQMFDAAVYLGVCDKIVPGLLIGALSFGHLPAVFIPAGPMPSGLSNDEKSKVRQLHAEGKLGRDALLEAEARSYHSPGTCTFYGTANSNQMLMEIMGLHVPGSTFVNPNTELRDELTRLATERALAITALGNDYTPIGRIVDERAIVNGIVGLLATGGSTNHTIHMIAMAAAAGISLTWSDLAHLSAAVPLLARIYPNGKADVNHFQSAGGMGFLSRELLGAGLLHGDVTTIWGTGLDGYAVAPQLDDKGLSRGRIRPRRAPMKRSCATPPIRSRRRADLPCSTARLVAR